MSLLEDEKKAEERQKTVANERAKISATYANGLAVALMAVGTLSPAVASQPLPTDPKALYLQAAIGFVCLIGSGVLHLQARRILGDLR